MRFLFRYLGKACVLACALATQGFAAESQAEGAGRYLTLSQVIAKTIARNPDLQASRYELKAAEARITQAALHSNPELSLQIDGLAGSGLASSADERQATLVLSQVIELGNKRGRRIEVATSERDLAGIEQQSRELDAMAEAARRYIAVSAAQERLSLTKETVSLTERTAKAVTARVEAARAPKAEFSRAQIALLRAKADERQEESVLVGARRALSAVWGDREPMFDRVRANLLRLEPLDSFSAFQMRLDRVPDLTRFASERRLREAEVLLAQAQARPNLTLSAGARRFQATGDIGFTAGFSVSLPLFDRNQGAIAEAQIRRRQTTAEESAAQIRLQAGLFEIYQQVTSSRDLLATLEQDVLPMAQSALAQTQVGYDRGRFSYLELGVAQQELLSVRTSIIDTAADVHRLTVELERLTAEPLVITSQNLERQ